LKLDLITTIEGFEVLQPEWNDLLPTSSTNQIFLTFQWQRTWWNAYQPGELFIIAGRNEIGALVGLAPWFIEANTRIMRGIGCVDVTDYLDVLAPAADREVFLAAVADLLVEHTADFTTLDLCNIPHDSATLELLPRFLTDRGFSLQIKQQEVCPIIELPADFEGYLAQLDKKQRHECRRKLRRIEENQVDKVEWYMVNRTHDLDAEIDKFLDLMRASHPEKALFLTNEQHLTFFRTMVHQVARCGWLQLSFLTVNDTPVSTYMNFDFNNRILVYNSGLLPEGYSQFSPGIVLLLYNIQHAINLRRPVFDFLRGNEEYKYRMGGKDRPVMNIEATCVAS
jgi:CelD/BcsL family acetyltransferase involved in cellulose biosynthesis